MFWLSAILVAAASNSDNLAVGVVLGIRDRRVPASSNLIIAGLTTAATFAAMTFGHHVSEVMPRSLGAWAAASIIIGIGVATVVSALWAMRASGADIAGPAHLSRGSAVSSYGEAFALGVALSVNNLGLGVAAGVAGASPLLTASLAGAFSLVGIGCGSLAGGAVAKRLPATGAPLIAGLLLVAFGALTLPGVR